MNYDLFFSLGPLDFSFHSEETNQYVKIQENALLENGCGGTIFRKLAVSVLN